ncbi:MAG: DUF5004 domain-containing protein [Bacteroidaceae bacterium]|nr:DUF5004 domain-containing protein [Bacteroidaceae bacterium]
MNIQIKYIFILMLISIMVSCSTNDVYDVEESVKDISGVWKLQSVSRNGVDITESMDFSQFALNLNGDGTYTIDNYLPFVVKENGIWSTDNPTMPFQILFKEESNEPVKVELNYPTVNGARSLTIKLSPGCYSNTYTYQLKRITE